MQPSTDPKTSEELLVPLERVSGFIRQVTHDVRNNLNAMDLQAAYVVELVTDPEALEEVKRIRGHIQQAAKQLQALSANFWVAAPNFVTYSARIFVEDLQDRLSRIHPDHAPAVQWTVTLGEEMISVDIEMIFTALSEIFKNAFQFKEGDKPIEAHISGANGQFTVELREHRSEVKSDPAEWGREPFVSTKRGGYGLGLFRARRILALHGGGLDFSFDSGRTLLRTRVILPFETNA